jgi:hypothetical protein
MAGDPTTFIARLLRPKIGENDWAIELRDDLEAIAEYLGQYGTATLAELNDGTAAIAGEIYGQPYYNTDDNWLAVCSTIGAAGTAVWVYFSNWALDFAAENLSFQWKKGQTTQWVVTNSVGTETYTPWVTPNPDDADQESGNYHLIQVVGAVTIDEPQLITGTAAAVLMLAFAQGGGGSIAAWHSVYKMAGGVELPVTEVVGEVDLFSCIRAPNGTWMVSPAFKFDVGY